MQEGTVTFGADEKTNTLVQQTITNTRSQVKFLGELSEQFEINRIRGKEMVSPTTK